MAKIKLTKTDEEIEARPGVSLMQTLLDAGKPVASSCGGEGVCSKCKVKVLSGAKHLTPVTAVESNCLSRYQIESRSFRLSCQAQVLGNIEVDTDYW